MNKLVVVGFAAATALGVGAVTASAGSGSGNVLPECSSVPGGVACTHTIPGVLDGASTLTSDAVNGLSGSMSGTIAGIPGTLSGGLNGTSGHLEGSLDGLLSGHIEGSLEPSGTGGTGHLCGDLNVAGQSVIDGGIGGGLGLDGLEVQIGGTLVGIPGGAVIDAQTGLPVTITNGGPCP